MTGRKPGRVQAAGQTNNAARWGPVKRSIGWDKIVFTHVVVIGVPAILYYYLRVGGASLFWLHVFVATAYLITALMICYEATAALFRRYAGSAGDPTSSLERSSRTAATACACRRP